MPVGSDETIEIAIRARYDGIKNSIDELKKLGAQLTAIDKQLRSGLNSDALNKQFAETAKQFDKVAQVVKTGSADSSRSIATVTSQVQQLNAEMKKAQQSKGVGFVGAKTDPAGFKQYQESMKNIGTPAMGGAKNIGMLVRNMRNLNSSLGDTTKAGILTKASFDAVSKGGSIAFMSPLTKSEQLNVKLKSLRANIEGLTQSMQSMAKDKQWIGRQMIEGITLPIVGLGTMAVRSFMSVQSEMIQLKKVTEFGEGKESADKFYDSLVNGAKGIREMSREFGIGRKSATSLFKDVAALGVDGEQDIKAFANAVSEVAMVGDVDTDTAMQFFRTMNAIFAGGKTNTEGLAETRDLMAQMSAVADETSLQLKDLAAAFPEVAPVMNQMGFSAAGVAASLAGMYKRGIPATEAAHGLKFALQRLVSPTKDSAELIDKMGFSFFDASGKIKKADVEIMALAKNLSPENMSAEASSKAMGELFGLRQTARMQSFFQDVNIGRKELEAYTAGTMKAADMTSDYARGLVAAGFGVKGAVGPINRYNKALEEIKKDPTTGLKRLKAAFDDFKVQLGASIAPALLQFGEQLTKLLDAFTNLPAGIQMAVIGAAGFLAVLGPVRYMSAQATHAISSMGQMAVKVLPKMAQMSTEAAAMMTSIGRRDFAMLGTRNVDLLSRKDTRRLKYGLPIAGEKAAKAAKVAGVSALAPETAATGTLTSAKEALTAASVKVAAAETAEVAAHNSNTAAMGAQAVAMNKGVKWDQRMAGGRGSWVDLNTKKTIGYTRALELMTQQQKAAHFTAPLRPGYTPPVAKPMSKAAIGASMTSQYDDIIKKAKAASAAQKQQQAFSNLTTTVQALNAKKTATATSSAAMGFGSLTGGVGAQFKSLGTSANNTFFKPIGTAAAKTKKQLVDMAKAAKISAVGQGASSLMGGTIGAFGKGRKGELAAGAATALPLGKVGKTFGGLGKIFGVFTGKLNIVKGPLGTIISLFLKFNKITLILTVVAGAIAFIVMMFKGMKTNWEAVMAKIQPGIDAIKAAFGRLKETFAGVFEKMMGIFGQLGTGAEEGKGAASAFEGIGGIIGTVFEGIASAIDFVGTVIEFIWPFFERTAYIVKNTIGFIAALFKGQWKQAFMFALAVVYEWVRPVLIAFDIVVKGVAQALSSLLGLVSKIPFVGNSLKGAAKAVEAFSDTGIVGMLDDKLRTGLGGVFGPGTTGPAKTEAKKAGGDIGDTLGEAINDGAGDAADGESWVKKWTETVVSEIDKQLEKLKKSATDALEKAHEAALKVYDERIKAIEDQEKAEERLFRTEEYLAKKRDLLAKRNLDNQNYQKDRALAIYEGRYNDARMLDLQEQVNKKSYSDELTSIEDSRSKDLLKEVRDGLKEQINAEKEAAKARFDIQKQSFEDYLEELYKMTPVTVGQFQSMMDQINGVLQQSGANWPGYAETAMDRMRVALSDANKKIINEFNRTENNPLLQWVAAFAEPEVVRILKEGLSKATGGSTNGSTGGAQTLTKEEADFLASLPSKSSQATPEELAAWVGTGQGLGTSEPGATGAAPAAVAAKGSVEAAMIDLQKGLRNGIEVLYDKDVWAEASKKVGELVAASMGVATVQLDPSNKQVTLRSGSVNPNEDKVKQDQEQKKQNDKANASYKEARAEIDKTTKELKKYGKTWSDVVVNNTTNWPKIFSKSVDKIEIYQDALKQNWVEVNGKLTNTFGETGEIIQTEHGQMIKYMNAGQVKYEAVSVKTYTTAKEVFEQMISQGIKPGTEAAKVYEQKINDLGGAVAVIDGKSIFIPIRLDDWAFWSSINNINKFLNTLALKNRIIAMANLNPYGGGVIIKDSPYGGFTSQAAGGGPVMYFAPGATDLSQGVRLATGGLVKAQKDGIIANIGEGGFDEFVITTDPKYRASNLGYLSAAASKLGVKMASGAAIKAASGGMFTSTGASGSSAEYASGMGGDVYINVDTFIGEEEWFASMASKYNMKTVPRQRKIEGQQKRVVSSYNDRYRLR
jgi:TP901 family phage tail tape measure protein